jgi:hypothetical protein
MGSADGSWWATVSGKTSGAGLSGSAGASGWRAGSSGGGVDAGCGIATGGTSNASVMGIASLDNGTADPGISTSATASDSA